MYHPYASRSSPTTSSSYMMRNNNGTTTNNNTTCVAVDGVILLEEAQARHSSGSSNDDDISSHVSSVSLVSSPVKYMIASLENKQQQQQQQCNITEDSKSIGGLSFDDYDSILTYDDDDDDEEEDEVTDVSSLQTGASVFHLPTPAAAVVVIPLTTTTTNTAYGGGYSSSSESSSRITTVTSSSELPLPYHSFSNYNEAGGGIIIMTTTTTDDQEYSTKDEESTMFAMSSSSSAGSGDLINLGHATINTMSILALTKSNDPLDISHVVQRGHGVATTIGPLGDELSYADAISNHDNHHRAGHNNTELLAATTDDEEEENRGRRAEKNNNILDDSEDDDNYFGLPNLIAYSSKRVKIVLVTAVAFIVGMLVLTMVFSATAYNSSDNNGFDGITTVAALGESTSIVGGSTETTATIPTITTLPLNIPTIVTISPPITISSPSFEPTTTMLSNNMMLVGQEVVDEAVGGKISFYLMADGGSRIKYWSSMLANLSVLNNHAFLVHLGSATRIVDNCDVNAYVRTKISLSASPIPVYSIPGDNDYPLCPDPSAGWKLYKENFMTIDTMYWNVKNMTSYIVNRQVPKREENFAFLYKRVLFIGLNMVNNVNDLVKTDILKDNIDWVVTNVNAYWTNVDVIFLMGYGRLLTIENVPFKDAMIVKARNEWSDKLLVYARRAATTAGTNTVANVTNFIELKVAPEWPIMEVSVRTRQRGSDDGSSSNMDNDDNLPFFQYFAATSGLKDNEVV